jgi:hypothetical protein
MTAPGGIFLPSPTALGLKPRPGSSSYLWGESPMTERPPVTPVTRERLRAQAKARWADPVSGAKWKASLGDPKSRAKVSEAKKALWADPVGRQKMRAALGDASNREKLQESTKARWADPAMREKMIAGMRAARKRRNLAEDDQN